MEAFYRFSDENFPLIMAGEITPWQSNMQRFVNTVRYLGVDAGDEHGVAFANRYTWLQNHMTLTEELQCMMRELSARSGIRLGVITNGASEFQWKKFHMLGLDEYIDKESVFVSGDLGVSKPDPGIFRAAQEGFGLPPENLWIVGDSVRADIAGAKACGWHTLWLRTGRENPEEVETDLMADSVDEMCRLVLNLVAAIPHQPM